MLKRLMRRIVHVAPVNYTNAEVADIIEAFLSGTGEPYDWDDFCRTTIPNPELEDIRVRCCGLDVEFPPGEAGGYCGPEGLAVLRGYVEQLRDLPGESGQQASAENVKK